MASPLDSIPIEIKEMIQDKLDVLALLMFEQTSSKNKSLVAETFQRKRSIECRKVPSKEVALALLYRCNGDHLVDFAFFGDSDKPMDLFEGCAMWAVAMARSFPRLGSLNTTRFETYRIYLDNLANDVSELEEILIGDTKIHLLSPKDMHIRVRALQKCPNLRRLSFGNGPTRYAVGLLHHFFECGGQFENLQEVDFGAALAGNTTSKMQDAVVGRFPKTLKKISLSVLDKPMSNVLNVLLEGQTGLSVLGVKGGIDLAEFSVGFKLAITELHIDLVTISEQLSGIGSFSNVETLNITGTNLIHMPQLIGLKQLVHLSWCDKIRAPGTTNIKTKAAITKFLGPRGRKLLSFKLGRLLFTTKFTPRQLFLLIRMYCTNLKELQLVRCRKYVSESPCGPYPFKWTTELNEFGIIEKAKRNIACLTFD